jgi:hypothetical protein
MASDLKRHAPTADNYHIPDKEQISKMRGSKVGNFAVIPSARNNGVSRGFDPTVAGPVHVDPYEEDGGVIFDPASVTQRDLNRAISQSEYPEQVFYALGTLASEKRASRAAKHEAPQRNTGGFTVDHSPNPLMPNAYVVPSAPAPSPMNANSGLYLNVSNTRDFNVQPVPSLHALPPITPINANPARPQDQWFPPQQQTAPQVDPNIAAMLNTVIGTQQAMQQAIETLFRQQAQAQLPATTGISHVPMPTNQNVATQPMEMRKYGENHQSRPIRRKVIRNVNQEIEQEIDEPRRNNMQDDDNAIHDGTQSYMDYATSPAPEGIIAGFETLGLKFVTGPLAQKARKQVVFEIPGAGKHMTRFHDVVDSAGCLVLIYDTRYEDGQQLCAA